MAKSTRITVTPNVMKCLEELKTAVKSLPAGDLRKRAEGALNYLSRTFKGESQPLRGRKCPIDKPIIR
ncbi:MAG: hypothetical protein ACETWK_13980 [Candidatus Aminicenantaceae bacterium]